MPTIIHQRADGDRVVSEAAAICHYLAEAEMPDKLIEDMTVPLLHSGMNIDHVSISIDAEDFAA